jgi:hypothetical protein
VDPFYKTMPAFFDMTFKELLDAKTPDAWPDFERGLISEEMLIETFFKDRRQIDGKGLKRAMANGYLWVPGMEEMLTELNRAGFELHACSNYPSWWTMIEGKLRLSDHLQWTFLSCQGPMKVRALLGILMQLHEPMTIITNLMAGTSNPLPIHETIDCLNAWLLRLLILSIHPHSILFH